MLNSFLTSSIDTQVNILGQANEIAKKNTVKEFHTYMDKSLDLLTQTAEYAKEIINTNSQIFTYSK